MAEHTHHQIVIIGGGTGGITVAAQLLVARPGLDIAIIEPASVHHYQPIWTLVGGGVFPREVSGRDMAEVIPPGAAWIQARAQRILPEERAVFLEDGSRLTYDALVVAAGIQVDWEGIPGLKESVGKPGSGVISNYAYETVGATFPALQAFPRGGRAIFTHPSTPIKCGGAPLKIMFLADETFRRQGVRDGSEILFCKAGGSIFAVKKYADALNRVADRKGLKRRYDLDLAALRPDKKEAVFRSLTGGVEEVISYDLIHVTPPMSAPAFLRTSPLAGAGGWVEVDKHSLQHVRFPEVFALGDSSNLPTSKTGAAIRKQAPTLVENLLAWMDHRPLTASYDGYTSCPLITGYGKLILAEFDYRNVPTETFPFDQSQERYSMYALKAYALPEIYWNGMLRGRL